MSDTTKTHRSVLAVSLLLTVPALVVAFGSNSSGAASASCGSISIKGGTISYASQNALQQTVGVTTSALSPAKSSAGGSFSFPVSFGFVNTRTFRGAVATRGGIKLSVPNRHSVSLTRFSVNTHNGRVSAQVNGYPYTLFRLGSGPTAFVSTEKEALSGISNSSGEVTFGPLPLSLIGTGATIINRDLTVAAVTPGYRLGVVTSHLKYRC